MWEQVVGKVKGSIAQIMVTMKKYDFCLPYRQPSLEIVTGTGFVIGHTISGTLLLTNAHVVENAGNIKVLFLGDSVGVPAKLEKFAPFRDIALISIPRRDVLPLEFKDSANLEVGSDIVVLGFPSGNNHL